ncbi:hypothetical protein N7447_006399 [Penicillium robsamsonii]|uniref:uncharacterized protein n=1 Tax=Penicillium robsamsonii TaxID=1792511 RepID=UPI002548BCBC|nr:uncharacterized protein N7447_006399 [Penicillium robsamsonii]KAJ5824059.1 hypothetical protein N7447_006399 [Penicillium robsamsonii]
MANFSQLPNEILLLVAKYLYSQKDINALVRTNWRLYHLLYAFLCHFNIQHHKSSGLLSAAGSGNFTIVEQFLDVGASISSFELKPDRGWSVESFRRQDNPLLRAAQNGHVELLKTMLSGTHPGCACAPEQLRTVLHWAINTGNQVIVELMIANKAPLGSSSIIGDTTTALSQAVRVGRESIIECILQTGWKWTLLSPDPFAHAVSLNDTSILQLLLNYGLHPQSDEFLVQACRQDSTAALRLLIDSGFDMMIYGPIALFSAIMHGNQTIVQFLIQEGVTPHLISAANFQIPRSTIWYAVRSKQLHILKLLVAEGVRPEYDALAVAKEQNCLEAIAILEKFSYEDIPEKVPLKLWIEYWEDKRSEDPNFHPLIMYQSQK